MSSDVFATFIGRALRAVTGEPKARNYWLRHTSASMELLQLFGDDFLLGKIARDSESRVSFPLDDSPSEFAVRLAGNDSLSQIHAAAFRNRRGHASMTTSITTYVHTISLVEPRGSRLSTDALNSHGIGALLDRSPESVRQLLSRNDSDLIGRSRGRSMLTLIKLGAAEKTPAAPDPKTETASMITEIKLGAVMRCVLRYFRTGDLDSSLALLGATESSVQLARQVMLTLPLVPARSRQDRGKNDAAGQSILTVNVRDNRHELHIGPKSVDTDLMRVLLKRVRSETAGHARTYANFWRLILSAADTRDRVFRCRSLDELQSLVLGAQWYLKDHDAAVVPALAIADQIDEGIISRDLREQPLLAPLPIIRTQFTNTDAALLPVTFTLKTRPEAVSAGYRPSSSSQRRARCGTASRLTRRKSVARNVGSSLGCKSSVRRRPYGWIP